jgi:hypothetical protein
MFLIQQSIFKVFFAQIFSADASCGFLTSPNFSDSGDTCLARAARNGGEGG